MYISVARNAAGSLLELFGDTEKNWDKYFMSRIHIVFLVAGLGISEGQFLNTAEVNTMTNLLLVWPSSANTARLPMLQVSVS